MSAKPETQTLPTQLAGAPLNRASCCQAGSCVVSTYMNTPSISWVANSPLVTDGEIMVEEKFKEWYQKGPLRAEWPFAVALYRNPSDGANALFVYHLAEKRYRTYVLPEDSSVAMLMGYQRAVAVLKTGFFLVDLFAPEEETCLIAATPLVQTIATLCFSKSKEILLCSMNDLQLWHFEVSENPYVSVPAEMATPSTAKLVFSSQVDGLGYTDIVWHRSVIAAASDSGTKVHVVDIQEGEDEACVFTQKIPVTRLFLDDEYFLMGLADGTIKVYGTDRLNFITQINLSPGTIHPASMPTSISGMMVLPYKVSYLSRHREFVVSSALDIVHRQLEISVWGIRGQHSVYPLTSFLIPGNVSYVSYDPLQQVVITISQQKDPANPRESIGTLQKVKLDMKSLASSMSKWKSTNETNQFKLAYGLIDEVTLEPNFAKALMRVEMSASEAEVVAEAMHTILKDKPELLKTLIDSAILHELDTKHGLSDTTVVQPSNRFTKHRRRLSSDVRPPSGSNSVTSSVEHSNTDSSSDDSSVGSLGEKGQMSTVTSLTSMTSNSRHSTTSSDDQSSGSIESSYNYWIPGAVTSTILSHFMVNTLHVYAFVTLSDPLTLLAKSESKYAFAISSSTTPETHRMMKRLMKIVATIIDGLIKHESHFLMSALQVLVQYHNRLKLDHPDMTDDKAIKIGAGRLFITHFVLAAWLEPVKFRMTSKIGSGSVNNMYIVAKLLESICLGSRDELEGEDLTEFRTKYGKKFQAWFHSKVANPERHVERSSKKSRHASSSVSSNSKAALKSAANIRNASLIVSQFIIAHNDDLIQALNNPLPGSTASTQQIAANEPTIARIKVLSDNLLRPIVSLMATEGAKDNYLADRLQVFSDMYGDLSSVETVKLVSASFRHDLDMERRAHASRTGVMPSSPLSSPDRHVASTKARTREDLPSLSDLAGSPYSSSGGLGLEPSASLNALNDNPIRKVRYTTTRPDSSPRSLKQLASPTINKRPSSLRLKTKHLRHIESSSFELSDLPSPNSARSAPLSPPSGSSGISGPGKSSISSDSSRSPPSGSASARAVLSGVPASQLSIPAPHISTKSKTSPLM